MSQTKPATPLLLDAASVRRGATRLAQRLRAERPAGALSSNKIGALSHLYRRGVSSPGDIATAEHQQPQSLTRVFAELEAAGLLSRSPSDHDGRQSLLTLTPAGRDALEADMAERDAWLAVALSTLTDAEIGLLRVAGELMDRLADAELADRVTSAQGAQTLRRQSAGRRG